MTWTPDSAGKEIEEVMEAGDLPEGDRDELRRLAEVLRRRKEKMQGPIQPPPAGMIDWLLGKDKTDA